MQISTNVKAVTLDVVKDSVLGLIGKRSYTAELCMEVKAIGGDLLFLTVDLVIYICRGGTCVFNFKAEALEVGHFKIAVHCLCGIVADGKTAYLAVFHIVCVCEEIGKRNVYCRVLVSVKINAEQELTAVLCAVGDPEVLDSAHTLDVCKHSGLAGLQYEIGIYLPAYTKLASGILCAALFKRSSCAHTLLAGKVFGAYGKGSDVFL